MTKLTLNCSMCRTELNESEMFEFGGTVGCEKCVRDHYRNRPKELEFELQSRRSNAVQWLKRNRRDLEKQAAKVAGTH